MFSYLAPRRTLVLHGKYQDPDKMRAFIRRASPRIADLLRDAFFVPAPFAELPKVVREGDEGQGSDPDPEHESAGADGASARISKHVRGCCDSTSPTPTWLLVFHKELHLRAFSLPDQLLKICPSLQNFPYYVRAICPHISIEPCPLE